MNDRAPLQLTEDELDTLVSIAIRRAEILDDMHLSAASEAWREVMAYEEMLATITQANDMSGGIARIGAVRAALAAGERVAAERLASKYRAEAGLSAERRQALDLVFQQYQAALAQRFPATAQTGLLKEVQNWRAQMASHPHLFPIPV